MDTAENSSERKSDHARTERLASGFSRNVLFLEVSTCVV
jgi:hypothetical protein